MTPQIFTKASRSNLFAHVLTALLVLLILFLPHRTLCQDKLKKVADGTTGETLNANTNFGKNRARNELNLGFTTFKIGLGFPYEYAGFSQDDVSKSCSNGHGLSYTNEGVKHLKIIS